MKKIMLILIIGMVGPATLADYSGINPFCNFKCESIPPLEDSHQVNHEEGSPLITDMSYTLVTWNIYKGRKDNFEDSFFTLMADVDIAAIQEHLGSTNIEKLYHDTISPLHSALGISFIFSGDMPTGVMNLSRWPIQNSQYFRTEDLEPFVKAPKGTIATVHDLPGVGQLLVVNIHGINFRRAAGLRRQLRQTEDLLTHHDGPIIYTGDFNTKNGTRLKETDEFLAKFGLQRLEYENDQRRLVLDHVYVRGVQVTSQRLLDGYPGSDHPPIKITFQGGGKNISNTQK